MKLAPAEGQGQEAASRVGGSPSDVLSFLLSRLTS